MRKPRRRASGSSFRHLNENEQRYCDAINHRLRELEAIYHARALVLDAELEHRVADPDDWLQDYEIDIFFDFQLRQDDPGFREDSDNYIASIRKPMKGSEPNPEFGIGALDYHHGDASHEITDQPHCRSYYEMYDNSNLYWRDILRIGTILAELQAWEQTYRDIEDPQGAQAVQAVRDEK